MPASIFWAIGFHVIELSKAGLIKMLASLTGRRLRRATEPRVGKEFHGERTMSVNFRNCKIIYEKYLLSLASRRKITKTRSMLRLLSLISALLMSYVPSLVACEGCKEPSNVIGASGVGGIGASFSWSVLFMIGMLAFLMTGMVLMMIRSCRQLAAQRQRVAVKTH